MKRTISLIAAVLLAFVLTACGNNEGQSTNETTRTVQAESSQETAAANNTADETEQTVPDHAASNMSEVAEQDTSSEDTGSTNEDGGVLVVYFSATGTTRGIAEKIAGISGADTYEIKAAEEYSDADLNWHDSDSRSTREQYICRELQL